MFKYTLQRQQHKTESPTIVNTPIQQDIQQQHQGPCRILLLPTELQIRIFVLAQNPALALTCGHFYELGQSDIVRAKYLIQRYGTHSVLGKTSISRKIVSLGVVQQLLRLKCCDPRADGDYWLFTQACQHNQIDLCQWIIDAALTMEPIQAEKNKIASHLLNIAVMKGAIPVIDLLIDTFGVDIHHHEEIALALACKENQVETVKHLASKYGCNLHSHHEKYLRNACLYGHITLVEFLLSAGSDVHAYSDSALQNAVYHQYAQVVKLLLDAGANAAVNGNVCLRHAITNMDIESVQYLIEAGADPRFEHDWPLRHACRLGLDDIVVYLINVIGNKDIVNMRDGLLLKECLTHGKASTVQLLLTTYYANPNSVGALRGIGYAVNPKTKTPYKEAMIKLLIEAGMDLNQQSEEVRNLILPAIASSAIINDDTINKTTLSWM